MRNYTHFSHLLAWNAQFYSEALRTALKQRKPSLQDLSQCPTTQLKTYDREYSCHIYYHLNQAMFFFFSFMVIPMQNK